MKYVMNWLKKVVFKEELVLLEARIQAYESLKESATLSALVREQLHGFDIHLLQRKTGREILDDCKNDQEVIEFLNHVHSLYTNPAYQKILMFLRTEQILNGFVETSSFDGLNFNRGTINGLDIFEDQVDTLYGKYKEISEIRDIGDPFKTT